METRYVGLMTLIAVAGCAGAPAAEGGDQGLPTVASDAIDTAGLRRDIAVLASDSFLGRLPGTVGEERTVAYLEREFRQIGLAPGNPDGSYVQKVPLAGITPNPTTRLVISSPKGRRELKFKDDVVAWTKRVEDEVRVDGSDLVFVGYGVQAPEFEWDDFKGADLAGKTLVMLVNDPPLPDSTQFGGRAMTYYGRWTYKYEQGMRQKAAAVLIVHETGPAGYPFAVVQGKTGEQFDMVAADRNAGRAAIEGWITLDQAKAMFRMAGQDFDAVKARAVSREFAPVSLGLKASMTIRNAIRTVDSRNVVAKLEGSDPVLKNEYVVYTAHWDHMGVGPIVNGDSIYNGAVDNATGTAGLLALARGFRALKVAPKRTIVFLAVTAEEQGLIGSQYYGENPLYPLAKTLANLNIDGLNVDGPTRDLTVIGYGASELDSVLARAAATQQRILRPDPEPEKGYYYRSDHFNFAKQGVPALFTEGGIDYRDQPADFGMKRRERYVAEDYHKPSDELRTTWDLRGAVDDLRLMAMVGHWVANGARYPGWAPKSEFRAVREKQLAR